MVQARPGDETSYHKKATETIRLTIESQLADEPELGADGPKKLVCRAILSQAYARIGFTTLPCTSVNRKRLP